MSQGLGWGGEKKQVIGGIQRPVDEEKSKKRKEAGIPLTLRTSSRLVKLPLRLLNSATLPLLVSAIMLALATPAPSQAGTLYRLEHVRR